MLRSATARHAVASHVVARVATAQAEMAGAVMGGRGRKKTVVVESQLLEPHPPQPPTLTPHQTAAGEVLAILGVALKVTSRLSRKADAAAPDTAAAAAPAPESEILGAPCCSEGTVNGDDGFGGGGAACARGDCVGGAS